MSIVLDQLTKRYEQHAVVNKVALQIHDAEFFVLLGPSGSGKSTILRMIAGLAPVDTGRIVLHGRDVTDLNPQARDVGFVFQNYALFEHMTVAENVEFALRIRKVERKQRSERRDQLLELVGLAGLGKRLPRQLSGGQQQRVALARALAHNPAVLLLDEPFGALDAKIRTDLRRNLRSIQRELGITTIFVTHDQEEAFELADRLGVMNMGRLLEVGTPNELYQRPQTEFVATFLGSANVLLGQCNDVGVQVGSMTFPLQTSSTAEHHPAVQVVIRPEDVVLAKTEAALRSPSLGQATVETQTFVGAFERIRLRLPALPDVHSIAPVRPFGEHAILIDALRNPDEARNLPIHSGDQLWIGVRRLHALSQRGLNVLMISDSQPVAETALNIGGNLARLAHARATVVARDGNEAGLRTRIQAVREQLGAGLPHLQTRLSTTSLSETVRRETEHEPCDIVVLGTEARNAERDATQLLSVAQQHVLLVPPTAKACSKALICLSDGEPSKEDVAFAGRLLGSVGASATLISVATQTNDIDRLERFLQSSAASLRRHEVVTDSKVLVGNIAQTINAEIKRGGYDLVIVGAPLGAYSSNYDLGSVVGPLLSQLSVPVLIIRSSYLQPMPERLALNVLETVA
ncbi:ATP-binding cassette domain-containing protein [Herpetosiphon giganteus]|uniref:ATP-binding cassette domain-containing protein n=1 Tax=Herpetosiphon giganteus TaxID=2029754 RepID=UPI0019563C41|nr:ATP-binding cassette domain-containing protein [Herpetosiphon giganteus]MBM7842004.1 sulfate transport system ATP-binding protein [Herpetosiphon giganteus]